METEETTTLNPEDDGDNFETGDRRTERKTYCAH